MSSVGPSRGNMQALTKTSNDHSNLHIAINMGGKTVNCDRCLETITDCACFCRECNRTMHPRCAGVKVETMDSKLDGRKRFVLPVPKELPLSCRDCLKKNPRVRAVTHSSAVSAPKTNSVTRILEQINRDDHMLVKYDENHRAHESNPGHELKLKDYETVYTCFGCKEKGFGPRHACKSDSCNFCLHPECIFPCTTIKHPFFPGMVFSFSSSPTISYCEDCNKKHSTRSCSACGMDVNGYYYYDLLHGKKYLHPCCASLQSQIIYGKSEIIMVLQQKITAACQFCGETKVKKHNKRTDQIWSYASVSQKKNVQLHVQCIRKLLSDLKDKTAGDTVLSINGHLKLCKITGQNVQLK